MPTFRASGRTFTTKKFTATTGGVSVTFPQTIKTIVIKVRDGVIWVKRNATDSNADAFPLEPGESIALDLVLKYDTDTATFGTVFTNSGTTEFFTIAGY